MLSTIRGGFFIFLHKMFMEGKPVEERYDHKYVIVAADMALKKKTFIDLENGLLHRRVY